MNKRRCGRGHAVEAGLTCLSWVFLPSITAAADGTEVYKRAARSVVVVEQGKTQGSGVLLSPTIIATNCHVVDKTDDASVRYVRDQRPARIVARNTVQDVCILEIGQAFAGSEPVAGVRGGSDIEPGEQVYAIGAPFGLSYSMTGGLVSQVRQHEGGTVIQFDAPISSGNSGGGLFDQRGVLLGLTSFSRVSSSVSGTSAQNLNFAWSVDNFPPPAQALVGRLLIGRSRANLPNESASSRSQLPVSSMLRGRNAVRWAAAHDAGNFDEAFAVASSWIDVEPQNPAAFVARGRTKESRHAGGGLVDFQFALQLQHGHVAALFHAARSARAQGDSAAFARYQRALISVNPNLAAKL